MFNLYNISFTSYWEITLNCPLCWRFLIKLTSSVYFDFLAETYFLFFKIDLDYSFKTVYILEIDLSLRLSETKGKSALRPNRNTTWFPLSSVYRWIYSIQSSMLSNVFLSVRSKHNILPVELKKCACIRECI